MQARAWSVSGDLKSGNLSRYRAHFLPRNGCFVLRVLPGRLVIISPGKLRGGGSHLAFRMRAARMGAMVGKLIHILAAWALYSTWGSENSWLWWSLVIVWIGMLSSGTAVLNAERFAKEKHAAEIGLPLEFVEGAGLR